MNCNFKSSNGTVVSEKDSLHERGGLIPAHVANDVIIVPPALAPGVKAAGGDAANISNNAITSRPLSPASARDIEAPPNGVKLKHSDPISPRLHSKTVINIGVPIVNGHRIRNPKHIPNASGPDKFHSSASIYLNGSTTSVARPVVSASQSSTNISSAHAVNSTAASVNRPLPIPLEKVLNADSVLARMSSDMIGRSYSSINDIATKSTMNIEPNLAEKPADTAKSYVDAGVATTPSRLHATWTVLKNPKFALYSLSLMAVAVGQGAVYVHLPAFAISMGTSADKASNLLAVIGLANIVSRFLSGLITSGNTCGNLTLYNLSLGLNGVFLLCAPIMGQTYPGQVAMALLFSLFGNCYCAIMTPLAIEFVGLQGLSIASGLLLMASGLGWLCGPPLAGNHCNSLCYIYTRFCCFASTFLVFFESTIDIWIYLGSAARVIALILGVTRIQVESLLIVAFFFVKK